MGSAVRFSTNHWMAKRPDFPARRARSVPTWPSWVHVVRMRTGRFWTASCGSIVLEYSVTAPLGFFVMDARPTLVTAEEPSRVTLTCCSVGAPATAGPVGCSTARQATITRHSAAAVRLRASLNASPSRSSMSPPFHRPSSHLSATVMRQTQS